MTRRQLAAWTLAAWALITIIAIWTAEPAQPAAAGVVILALHPGGSNGDTLYDNLGWGHDLDGIPILYPDGENGEWNSGWGPSASTRDDITYLRNLTAGYTEIRIYGRSQGAMMGHRLAVEDPRVTALAAKSGSLPKGIGHPSHPIRVMHWHGDLDTVIPRQGDEWVFRLKVEKELYEAAGGTGEWRILDGFGHAGQPPGFDLCAAAWLWRPSP